eukprot:g69526.t1
MQKACMQLAALLLVLWVVCAQPQVFTSPDELPDNYILLSSAPFSGHFREQLFVGKELVRRGYTVVFAAQIQQKRMKAKIATGDEWIKAREAFQQQDTLIESMLAKGMHVYKFNDTESFQLLDPMACTFHTVHGAQEICGQNPLCMVKRLSPILSRVQIELYFILDRIFAVKPPNAIIYEHFTQFAAHVAYKYGVPGIYASSKIDQQVVMSLFDVTAYSAPFIIPYSHPKGPFFQRLVNVLARCVVTAFQEIFETPVWYSACNEIGVSRETCWPLTVSVPIYGHLVLSSAFYPLSPIMTLPPFVEPMGPPVDTVPECRDHDLIHWFEVQEKNNASVVVVSTGSDMLLPAVSAVSLLDGLAAAQTFTGPIAVLWIRGQDMLAQTSGIQPENYPFVRFSGWTPQTWALRHKATKLFVSHCGSGGLSEAMIAGVPVLGTPLARDQPINAMKLVNAGAGAGLSLPLHFTSAEVTSKAAQLLSDASFRHRLHYIQKVMSTYTGIEGAIRAFEEHLTLHNQTYKIPYDTFWGRPAKCSLDVVAVLAFLTAGLLYGFLRCFSCFAVCFCSSSQAKLSDCRGKNHAD